jgi:hypothetical protein
MIESPSLIILDPCLTLLSSACISFTSNPVYSLARVYQRPISWRFRKCLPFALVKLGYSWFGASTQHGVGPLRAMSSWSHSCLHISVILNSAEDQFSLEVITSMDDVILDVRIWESSFLFQVSARVVGPRRPSKEAQHKQSYEAQSNYTRCPVAHSWMEKLSVRSRSFSPSNGLDIFVLRYQGILHCFLCFPPPFINHGTRFLLRGSAVTPRVIVSLITFIKVLIKKSNPLINPLLSS